MKTIAFYTNAGKPGAEETKTRLAECARRAGLAVADAAPGAGIDFVASLGGDGTMLAAVHAFPGVPALGLNLGSLGFLAAVERPLFEKAIADIAAGRYRISMRTMLSAKVVKTDGTEAALPDALNDVVITRAAAGHAACMEVEADGAYVSSFLADGLVVATPTGSTAYSLAAGGPVLTPGSACIVVTPACPHALASRPIVMPDTAALAVRAVPKSASSPAERLAVSADGGAPAFLEPGDMVAISKSARKAPLAELEGHDAYETLCRKLGWSGRFPGVSAR